MKSIPCFPILLIIISFCSCSNPLPSPPKQDSLSSSNILAGKLYLFAPQFDSTKLVAAGDCDCCSGNTLFLDDSTCLDISYCDEGATYKMGKYHLNNQILSLDFDSVCVNANFMEDDSAHGKSGRSIYHIAIQKSETRTYQEQVYKGTTIFMNKEVGAPDKESKFSVVLKSIQDEGIWDKLKTNPASIPRNSVEVEIYLQGTWVRKGDSIASMKIMEDSIYFMENNQKHSYSINHDSLRTMLNNKEVVYPVKIPGPGTDTLIFEGPEKQIFYRYNSYE